MMPNQPRKESLGTSWVQPKWWREEMTSGWERGKAAVRRDWEQTKHDLSAGRAGADLGQDVADTVKQAAGKETFETYEDSMRYGYGAATYYSDHKSWDEKLESKLRQEWQDLKTGRTWDEMKSAVRHGWNAARRMVH